jgi:hypothetical protein
MRQFQKKRGGRRTSGVSATLYRGQQGCQRGFLEAVKVKGALWGTPGWLIEVAASSALGVTFSKGGTFSALLHNLLLRAYSFEHFISLFQ